jgi:hypothetical protein
MTTRAHRPKIATIAQASTLTRFVFVSLIASGRTADGDAQSARELGRPAGRAACVDLPDGDYRVSVVWANGAHTLASLAVSGLVVANGRPALLDVPLLKGSLVRRSFTARVLGGALELRFGGATGFGVAALVVEKADALVPDPLEAGAIRSWRVSERHPNPDWAPLRDLVVPAAQSSQEIAAPEQGIPLVDLGTLAHAEIGDVVTASAEIERASAGPPSSRRGSSAARPFRNKARARSVNLRGVERDEGTARIDSRRERTAWRSCSSASGAALAVLRERALLPRGAAERSRSSAHRWRAGRR